MTTELTIDKFYHGLAIEREGPVVKRITKNGVVIWAAEHHTAGMAKDTQINEDKVRTLVGDRRQELNLRGHARSLANNSMIGGSHYVKLDSMGSCPQCGCLVQHWDWAHNLRGLEYAATKYIARWRDKGGLDSLKKAIHYIQKLIEIHFPNVVVSISYTNRSDNQSGEGSGKCGKAELTAQEAGTNRRGEKATGGSGVVGGSPTYSENLGAPLESPDYEADGFPAGGRDNY